MRLIASLLFVLLAASASAQDGIDLTQAVYHGSPNVSSWPITVRMDGVEFKPGRASDGNTVGIRPIFDRAHMNSRWPDVKPVGWDGFIQYTLWACVKPQQIWHCAGLHEFWSDRNGAPRIWSGAPVTTQWNDWVYRGQWGPEMQSYQPKLGDEMVFGLTAGDRRLMDLGDVRERSNFVRVPVSEAGIPPPLSTVSTPPVVTGPVTPPITPPDLSGVQAIVNALAAEFYAKVDALQAAVKAANDRIDQQQAQIERVDSQLQSVPIVKGCRASAFGVPLSCRVE